MTVESLSELAVLVDELHDKWFNYDAIEWDKVAKKIVVPFALKSKHQVDAELLVYHVVEMVANDSEQIGWYDFNEFRYDESQGALRVLTGVPLDLCFSVSRLRVELVTRE